MKQVFTTALFLFTFSALCLAQETNQPKLNALSFELGKTGLIYNLNFDHKIAEKPFGYRVVAGSNFNRYLNATTFGAGGYGLLGKQKNFLELGADVHYLIVTEESDDQRGFTFVYPDYSSKSLYTSINIGYRRYGKATLFRIGFSPGVIKSEVLPGGYISLGVTF